MLLHFLIFTCKKIKTKIITVKSLDEKNHEKGENEFRREPNRQSIKTIIKIQGQDKNAKNGPGKNTNPNTVPRTHSEQQIYVPSANMYAF